MTNEDFELTSEDSGSSTGQTNDNLWYKEKIREVTAEGNLKIPTDEVWGYWKVLNSEEYFERLFLDIDQAEKITNETVANHYEEIKRYLNKWRERESTGISFAQTHGGYSATELAGKLNEAYAELKGKLSREEYINAYLRRRKNKSLKSLDPVIKAVLADKVLTYEEKMMVYQEGEKLGLNITETDRYLKEAMSREGDIRDVSSSGNTVKSAENSTATASYKDDERLTIEDLKDSGMIEEYLEGGGKLTGEAWVEFYKKIRQSFAITGISELKKLTEEKGIKQENETGEKRAASRTKSVVEMVFVKGGIFLMGSTNGEYNEEPVHGVTVSDFMIGKYEVTQELWKSLMGNNPSWFTGDDNLPVERVSWYDAVEFCNKLSEKEGLQKVYCVSGDEIKMDTNANGYRLPTEAEWEYAAKGGSKSKGYKYNGSNNAGDVAWYLDNSGWGTHPVGQKKPNELGLYDMSGNVWEWCWDWYGSYSSASQTNPIGPSSGSVRVYRGGSSYNDAGKLRPANRSDSHPDYRDYSLGFRLAMSK